MTAIIFALAVFCGWFIFDFVKHKKVTMEMVMSSLVISVIAGVAWWLLDFFF
ncbi:hypothetical protein [Halalkalibacter sp. APA_J-10(15)]|uniref:hypothetical protein n=1 Tax=unclassified Halalkalibacter TaxID=2893063 RepID=UPI001FF36950|nr:hypothetical protein [Halalkalibacter sp. APA_J-10(15)]MCK0472687.1 hypothetical protein [Halalkalibacter sp. APA_J-10(15)]